MKRYIKYFFWILGAHLYLATLVNFYYNPDLFAKARDFSADLIGMEELSKNDFYRISLAQFAEDHDPILYDENAKRELDLIFEPLVTFDDVFNIKPALASSWGMISDTEWKFILRKDAFFHDGTRFDADDVIATFERVKKNPASNLYNFVQSIRKIEKIDQYNIKITTKNKSPNFLSKMTGLYITAKEDLDKKIKEVKIGTGRYEMTKKSDEEIIFKRFEKHWDKNDVFPPKIKLEKNLNKYARFGKIVSEETDVLVDVPPIFKGQIEDSKEIKLIENTGVNSVFLLFNTNVDFLKNIDNRKALSLSINRDEMIKMIGEPNKIASQYASSGIFGFNPNIQIGKYDKQEAKKLLKTDKRRIFNLYLTQENSTLGEFLKQEMENLEIRIVLKYLSQEELLKSMKNKEGDIYLLGWSFQDGNVDDFFKALLYKNGRFQGLANHSPKLKETVSKALMEMNDKKRMKAYQEAMRIITEDQIIGIPLFEVHNIFAVRNDEYNISFRPDGVFYF